MNSTIDNNVNATTAQEKRKVELGNFGAGRYSPAMTELYKDTQRLLGFTREQAHVTAARLGIDCGRLANQPVSVKVGKSMTKNGERSLKEVTKSVKCPNSWAMSVAAVCIILDEARSQSAVINDVKVNDKLMEFINEAADHIEADTE